MASQIHQGLGYNSNAHRALAIPELLSIIFSYASAAENCRNALVCRTWNPVALDYVWREVDNLYYLLCLLAPMHRRTTIGFCFVQPPTQQDWTRFTPYARRVRSLKFLGLREQLNLARQDIQLDDSVFQDIARTRTTLAVLPNLRRLWWLEPDRRAHQLVFMHEGIEEFHVSLQPLAPPPTSLDGYFADVTARMPALRDVSILCNPGDGSFFGAAALQGLIRGLPKLKRITLPKESLNGHVLNELSALPELLSIEFDTLGGINCNTPRIHTTVGPGGFPALWDLCLNADLADMRNYLVGRALLPNLTSLFVESLNAESATDVHDFLSDIVEHYPGLEMLSMDVVVPMHEQNSSDMLTLDHIRPVLSLKNLKTLEIRHNYPLDLGDADLTELAKALPLLESLALNPEPLELLKPSLDLQALVTLGKHCPALQKLGVYLNADRTTNLSLPPISSTRLLPALHTLNFGVSPISGDHIPVALFVSHLVSENVALEIESGVTWSEELYEGEPEYEPMVDVRCEQWAEVAKTVPLLLELRKQERRQRREIEREVEDLRMRNEILVEQSKLVSSRPDSEKSCIIG